MMKFVLVAALVALYWATPTLGLKCYGCVPKKETSKVHNVDCEAFDKMSVADRKAKATENCTLEQIFCVTITPKDKNEKIKGCFHEQMTEDSKLVDGKCKIFKDPKDKQDFDGCACKTDYCNTASFSRSPSIFMLGFAVVVTFLNAKMNAR